MLDPESLASGTPQLRSVGAPTPGAPAVELAEPVIDRERASEFLELLDTKGSGQAVTFRHTPRLSIRGRPGGVPALATLKPLGRLR